MSYLPVASEPENKSLFRRIRDKVGEKSIDHLADGAVLGVAAGVGAILWYLRDAWWRPVPLVCVAIAVGYGIIACTRAVVQAIKDTPSARLFDVDVVSSGEPCLIDLRADAPYLHVYFKLTNKAPVPARLTKLTYVIWFGQTSFHLESAILDEASLAPYGTNTGLRAFHRLTDAEIRLIQDLPSEFTCKVYGFAYFDCDNERGIQKRFDIDVLRPIVRLKPNTVFAIWLDSIIFELARSKEILTWPSERLICGLCFERGRMGFMEHGFIGAGLVDGDQQAVADCIKCGRRVMLPSAPHQEFESIAHGHKLGLSLVLPTPSEALRASRTGERHSERESDQEQHATPDGASLPEKTN